jgi:hypothetical protein
MVATALPFVKSSLDVAQKAVKSILFRSTSILLQFTVYKMFALIASKKKAFMPYLMFSEIVAQQAMFIGYSFFPRQRAPGAGLRRLHCAGRRLQHLLLVSSGRQATWRD